MPLQLRCHPLIEVAVFACCLCFGQEFVKVRAVGVGFFFCEDVEREEVSLFVELLDLRSASVFWARHF